MSGVPKLPLLAKSLMAALSLVGLSLPMAMPASASPASFVADLWPDAQARGVKRTVFEASLNGFQPSPRIVDQTRKQPEFAESVGAYVGKRVTDRQVATGRKMRGEWAQTLAAVSSHYGVQPELILAIWGMETNFGSYMGGNNTIHALATLTYEGYRKDFFRNELLTALQIASDGHISPKEMVGSWAGAMGHTQFMPSSFVSYAVDWNRDGRTDIWNSIPDALASTANYLKSHGWTAGETWGYEVQLPRGFDYGRAWGLGKMPISAWQAMGITRVAGRAFPRQQDEARLYMPAGGNGPVFLLLRNFDVIKRYNNSDSYALAVGHLADRVLGSGSFVAGWPADDKGLTRPQRLELQQLLSRRGFDVGTPDGVIGPRTRQAIMSYQARNGMLADGHASGTLLTKLR
ncbi:membrane-bound lytic murein transglycosylase B [Devosia enhydra]|uniref:Membrane-bound lytic murein transglycosylase B n=2 Tax=Devosia enhydra TaxID=665118 RepID=A0A1K2I2U6_9HYPH|nr:membrane-bound lytic murein transglycosylase B [Devosia enhydra]